MGKKLIIKGADFSKNGFVSLYAVLINVRLIQNGIFSADGKSLLIKVSGKSNVVINKTEDTGNCYIAMLTDYVDGDTEAKFATGYSDAGVLVGTKENTYTIPSNAKYLLVLYQVGSNDYRYPESINIDGIDVNFVKS